MAKPEQYRQDDEAAEDAGEVRAVDHASPAYFITLRDIFLVTTLFAAAFAIVGYLFRNRWEPWQHGLFITFSCVEGGAFAAAYSWALRRERQRSERLGRILMTDQSPMAQQLARADASMRKRTKWNGLFLSAFYIAYVAWLMDFMFHPQSLWWPSLFLLLALALAPGIGKQSAEQRVSFGGYEFRERGIRTHGHRAGFLWSEITKAHWWYDTPGTLEVVAVKGGNTYAVTLSFGPAQSAWNAETILKEHLTTRYTPMKVRERIS